MGSRSFEVNFLGGCGVDKHSIWLNVGISVSGPIEFERMIFVLRRQGLRREQKFDQPF
jgi:hypothetical protein